jgi:hypothetical protein
LHLPALFLERFEKFSSFLLLKEDHPIATNVLDKFLPYGSVEVDDVV